MTNNLRERKIVRGDAALYFALYAFVLSGMNCQFVFVRFIFSMYSVFYGESHHEKNGFLPIRKQRRRSAVQ